MAKGHTSSSIPGFVRKKTIIKKRKTGEIIEERQSNFTAKEVVLGAVGIGFLAVLTVAAVGSYKFLSGEYPWTTFKREFITPESRLAKLFEQERKKREEEMRRRYGQPPPRSIEEWFRRQQP